MSLQNSQVWSLGCDDPWRKKWQPTPVFLPRQPHGQRILVSCSPWDGKEPDMVTEHAQLEHSLLRGSQINTNGGNVFFHCFENIFLLLRAHDCEIPMGYMLADSVYYLGKALYKKYHMSSVSVQKFQPLLTVL